MELYEARVITEDLLAYQRPYCERIEIAGSVRRRRPQVNDIEIVCIPKTIVQQRTLFHTGSYRDSPCGLLINNFHQSDLFILTHVDEFSNRAYRKKPMHAA